MNAREFASNVLKVVDPLGRRVRLMVGRAILKVIDDTQKCQTVQANVLEGEAHDVVERFQEYGFTSVPEAGAEAIVVALAGDRSHLVSIASEDRRYRPTGLQKGEVAIYTLQNGIRILLKDDGKVMLGTEPTEFVALANLVLDELNKVKDAFNSHTHSFSGTTTSGCSAGGSSGSCTGTTAAGPVYTPASVAAEEVLAK